MAVLKTSYCCQNCGAKHSKWLGQCSSCKEWNTLVEEVIKKSSKVDLGLSNDQLKSRALLVNDIDFEKISVMSLYLPSGTNVARLEYKFQYMKEFMAYIGKLKEDIPNLVICGDYNICHQAIDIHDPIRNSKISGFLPWEREWLSDFMGMGFTDSFRKLNKDPDRYSWWSYRANSRVNNKGWRIDYNLVSNTLSDKIKSSTILDKIVHSDHCPIVVELNL
ncbi:exodeoxyribonuclease III [bacterium]|nr:exodeoxyribonuclease III [bacterium]